MEKIDLRKLNTDELYNVRKQVVRLKKQGLKSTRKSKYSKSWRISIATAENAIIYVQILICGIINFETRI